jgi:malonyl-CoA/methylmalonyl-CoA synthetase
MAAYLYDLFARRAPSPAKVFIETPDGRKVSYGDLAAGSARIANALVDRGIVAGDRVAVQVDKSADAILLYLACLRTGAVFLPLNTAYTPAEIEYFLGDARPRVFVCEPHNRDKLLAVAKSAGVAHVETLGLREDGSLMEAARIASDAFEDVARGPDDLAAILYTSGTTGRSKGAMLSHDNLASNALTLVGWADTQHLDEAALDEGSA